MADAADIVLYAPTSELVADSAKVRRNPRAKKKTWKPADESLEPFGEFASLLVRTALIRSEQFEPSKRPRIESPRDVVRMMRHLKYEDQENIVVVCIDAQNRVNAIHPVSLGTPGFSATDARTVCKAPMLTGSSAVILVHNHPSGTHEPSGADKELTKRVNEALCCVGLVLVDHLIIAGDEVFSFFEHGLVPEPGCGR